MEQTEIAREQGAPAASILAEQAWEGKVRKVFSWIVSVYLCVVFGAFPLYFHNYYYDILVSKYQFYWLSTVAIGILSFFSWYILQSVTCHLLFVTLTYPVENTRVYKRASSPLCFLCVYVAFSSQQTTRTHWRK